MNQMQLSTLRRGRLDVWTKTVHCHPILTRGVSRDSNEARLAAIELRDMIDGSALSCEGGWHVAAQGEAYRVACMLQS